MRSSLVRTVLFVGALALPLAACANPQPVTQFGLNRDTPEATFDWFIAAAKANQWAAEWSVFSPNARQQANQLAGRNVDLGDYATVRQTPLANNASADMATLLQSRIVDGGVQPISETAANVTIAGGGRSATVRMVKLTTWELRVKGEAEPYSGFVRSPGDVVALDDGSVTVRIQTPGNTASFLRTIPREQIDGFAVKSMWYVDDLSGLQGAVTGIGSGPAEAPPPEAAPPTQAPPPPPGDFGGLD